jgi:hypothetical protein
MTVGQEYYRFEDGSIRRPELAIGDFAMVSPPKLVKVQVVKIMKTLFVLENEDTSRTVGFNQERPYAYPDEAEAMQRYLEQKHAKVAEMRKQLDEAEARLEAAVEEDEKRFGVR